MAITDLTNTKWKINSGWNSLDSVDLTFNINASLDDSRTIETMRIYTNNFIYFYSYQDGSVYLTNDKSFILNIYDGTDVTNTSLISWLETYGEQIVEEQPKEYTLRIDGVEVTDYENVIVNGVIYKCKKGANVPTDLTGYTISVPSGWSANSGFGKFDIQSSVDSKEYTSIQIGYTFNPGDGSFSNSNFVSFVHDYTEHNVTYQNHEALSFTISGGMHVTNQDLIQWFVDNGATFTKVEQQKTIYVYNINGGATYTFNVGNASTYGDITFPCYDVGGSRYLKTALNGGLGIYLCGTQANDNVYHIYTGSLSDEVEFTDSIENGATLYCTGAHSGGAIN